MKRKVLILTMVVVFALSSFAHKSEKRFGYELNSGLSVATKEIADAGLNPGFGFEGIIHYRFMPHLGL